jgi:iron complex outermembrane receptor protein
MRVSSIYWAFTAAIVFAAPRFIYAADAVGPPTDAAAGELTEIIVTATKRAENLQDVAQSIAVVSPEDAQLRNLTDTSTLTQLVPALNFKNNGTPMNDEFVVRGVGTQALGAGLEQSVGVVVDGVPLGRELGAVTDLVDVKQVEVLEGPQGTLFGKNASAGVLNLVTNEPVIGKTDIIARVAYGNYNFQQYSSTVNLPISDDAAIRVTGWKFKRDGFIDEVNTGREFNDKNSDGARVRLRWTPSDKLDLNLIAQWNGHNENGVADTITQFVPANFTSGPGGNSGALIESWELAHGTMPGPDNLTARGIPTTYYNRGSTGAYTAQADYSLGAGTLTSIASYRIVDNNNPFEPYPTDNPYNAQPINVDIEHYNQSTAELRYASAQAERFRYVAGLFYFNMSLHEEFEFAFPPIAEAELLHLRNTNYAAFSDATFDVTPVLRIIGGVRFSRDSISGGMQRVFLTDLTAEQASFYGSPPVINPIIPGFTSPGSTFGAFQTATTSTYDNVSWRAGLQYDLGPSAMTYFTASRGYKGEGLSYVIDTVASTSGIIKPEVATMFELGLKSQWFDRHLTANVAAYDETFDNFQAGVLIPAGAALAFGTINAPQLKSDGVEATLRWTAPSHFSLAEDVNLDNARFTDFPNAECAQGQTVAEGCVHGAQNLKGYPLTNSPKFTNMVTGRFETDINADAKGFIQLNHVYRSHVVFNADGDVHEQQGGYGLVNLSVGVRSSDGRLGASIYGNNLADKRFADTIGPNANGAFFEQHIPFEALRSYGVALDGRF